MYPGYPIELTQTVVQMATYVFTLVGVLLSIFVGARI